MKRNFKKMLACLCILTILAMSLAAAPKVQASEDAFADYEAVTLSDFGVADGAYTNNSAIEGFAFRNKVKGRTSLDKTVLTMYATFATGTNLYYGIGEISDWTAVTLKLNDANTFYLICDDWNSSVTFKASELNVDTIAGTEIKVKLAAEITGSDLKITASINNCEAKTLVKAGASSSLNTCLAAIGNISVRACTDEDLFAKYTPVTLEDFGLQDKNYTVSSWEYTFQKNFVDGSNFDQKNLIMNVTFHDAYGLLVLGDTDSSVAGSGIIVTPNIANSTITIWSPTTGTYSLVFDKALMGIESLAGTKIKCSIAMEYMVCDGDGSKNDLKVMASINDCAPKTMYLKDHISLGNGLSARVYGKLDLESYYEKSLTGLKRITWKDFGITEDKQYTLADVPANGVIANTAGEEITTLIGTSFRGRLGLTRGNDSKYFISYGDYGLNSLGIRLLLQSDGSLLFQGMDTVVGWPYVTLATLHPQRAGLTSFTDGSVFELGIDIWQSGNDVKINLFVEGAQCTVKAAVWKNAVRNNASSATKFLGTNLNVFSLKQDGDQVLIDVPEASPERLSKIGWEDFGIFESKQYTLADVHSNGLITNTAGSHIASLVGTSFRGEISLKRGNDSNYFISYGDYGLNTLGIRITPQSNGTLLFQGMDTVVGWPYVSIAVLEPEKAGLTSFTDGSVFELGIDIWEVEDPEDSVNDIKINLFINGIQCTQEAVVWENALRNNASTATKFWGTNMHFASVKSESDVIVITLPEKEKSPEGLAQICWEDFGITGEETSFHAGNEEIGDGTHVRTAKTYPSLVGTSFRGIVTLTRSSEPASSDYFYFCYGSKASNWSGIRMNLLNGKLNMVGVGLESDGTATTKSFGVLDSKMAGITSFIGAEFELGIDLWADGNDVKMNIFINGKQYNRTPYTWENAASKKYISNAVNMIVHGASDAMNVKLPVEKACDIQETPSGYLLSGTNIRLNDKLVENGTTLTDIGAYHVLYKNEDGVSAETVICYIAGDAHVDANLDILDLVAVKKAVQGQAMTSKVAKKAADANKDSIVNDNDAVTLRKILLGAAPAEFQSASYSLRTQDTSVMPIGGFYGPCDSLLSEQTVELIKKSGINFMTFLPAVYGVNETDNSQVAEALRLAEKQNLSVFVTDERIRGSRNPLSAKEIADVIKDYSRYRSFAGLSIIDEPSTDSYGETSSLKTKHLSYFSQVSESLNAYANLSAYVNLFPLNKLLHIDQTKEYETLYQAYLTDYCKNYHPKYLSYDHYPFEWGTNAITGANLTEDRYFKNLAIVRKIAKDNHIPFWTHVGAGDHFGSNKATVNNRPTEGQFKWQVNLELAFGAKGIQYFPLIQPQGWEITEDGEPDYKRNGLIGANGETTDWYNYAVDMNQQIRAVDHVLMNSINEGIMVTTYGYAATNMAAAGAYEMPVITDYNHIVTGIDSTGTRYGAVAGCFDYQGKTAVYLVNYDVNATQTISLKINGKHAFTSFNRYGSNTGTVSGKLSLEIEKGEAVLIVFD